LLIRVLFALSLLLWAAPAGAQALALHCGEVQDDLLAVLTSWCGARDSTLDFPLVASATGAGLAVAYAPDAGFELVARQKLLWPGNLLTAIDSDYAPVIPFGWSDAESLLVAHAMASRSLLLFGPTAAVVTGVDTSLGAPWFFVVLCDSGSEVTPIWDAGDLRSRWWRWTDLTAANTVWPLPPSPTFKLGRKFIRTAMRNLVLAARPDSSDLRHFGLAALALAKTRPDRAPGLATSLGQISALRRATAGFLERSVEYWPPKRRDPLKLAAFYLQKDAEAWQTLAAVSGDWLSYDPAQRTEWLSSVLDWETKAAVALDQIVSQPD
jgi:hypothetical protein